MPPSRGQRRRQRKQRLAQTSEGNPTATQMNEPGSTEPEQACPSVLAGFTTSPAVASALLVDYHDAPAPSPSSRTSAAKLQHRPCAEATAAHLSAFTSSLIDAVMQAHSDAKKRERSPIGASQIEFPTVKTMSRGQVQRDDLRASAARVRLMKFPLKKPIK